MPENPKRKKNEEPVCRDHSGCISDIVHLQRSDKLQWQFINSIHSRLNVLLGGVAVSCILLAINIVISFVRPGAAP